MSKKLVGFALFLINAIALVGMNAAQAQTPAYSVGGSINGLVVGQSVTLLNNGADGIAISKNGEFSFPARIAAGATYLVTIGTQPADETCFTTNAVGVVEANNINSITVSCFPNSYYIGGTVSGLGSGKSLVLQNNGGDSTTVSANGGFFFPTDLPSGSGYSVTVSTQPANQICSITNGTGFVNGAIVSNIGISCINTFIIGGTLTGLTTGKSVILRNNGGDTLILSGNGNFTFATPLTSGASYSIGVAIQPSGQTCQVTNGSGTATSNVTNVIVSCSATYTVAGSISGLTSSGLVLRLNATNLIIANGATTFKFATALTDSSPYSVSVGIQPIGMSCSLINGNGVISAANVTNVAVTCNKTYSVGGTISGLTVSGLILKLNGGANKIVSSGSTSFTFSTALISGTPYAVTIQQQPTGWTCFLLNASGTILSSNVGNVSLLCSPNTYTIGGAVAGLGAGNTLVLKNNGGNSLVISGNGVFNFSNPMTNGSSYSVSIGFQPAGQICVLKNASGTVISSDISNVAVACGPYTVSGAITGLDSSGLILSLNGVSSITPDVNSTSFTFPLTLTGGQNYAVTVVSQPSGLVCGITNGAGIIDNVDIKTVSVACVTTVPPATPVPTVSYTGISNQVLLSWLPDTHVNYFKVSKVLNNSSQYSLICQENSPTATSCLDSFGRLTDFVTATYKVTACNSAGCTDSIPVAAFTQQAIQYIKASNTNAFDYFGVSVALSADGSTLAVGTNVEASAATGINGNQSDNSAPNAGAVYVFTRSGSAWSQQAYIKASNTNSNDSFGTSVALSGDGSLLAVGATGESSNATGVNGNQFDNSALQAGAVYVFTRSGSAWSQQAYIKASNTDASDRFGQRLALSTDGTTLAVGASGESSASTGINGNEADNTYSNSGAVYIFKNNADAWYQQAYIKASNTDPLDYFGWSVSLSGDGSMLAVGAYRESSSSTGINGDQADNNARYAGAVYVFTCSGDTWSQQAYIKASNTDGFDAFGNSVSLSAQGDTLAVGAYRESSSAAGINGDQTDNSAVYAGAVYLFTRDGNAWSQQAYVKASNAYIGYYFGGSVALSADGNELAIGSYRESSLATGVNGDQSDKSAPNAGAVYVFTRSGNVWSQQDYMKASNTDSNDYFGNSVALSGDGSLLAVGAYRESSSATGINGDQTDNTAVNAGAVYLY